ncbi:PucR family transcriptional regulator [Pseudonocardia acaciae]|uniref:PucR family transcriptional regulator n=1 Tax=Pseudonocardia acaciae TaxID=551276 RepID=UPI00068581C5|nr:helix-turn-helix domain-containing protein [Pseudonocardia acaciae]
MAGARLDLLLDGIEGTLADLPVVPASGCPSVVGLAILDPDDEFGDHHDELVLVIGARGRESLPFLRAAARSGAVAVAVKTGPSGAVSELASAATEAGVALLAVRPQVRWDRLGALLRERLEAWEFGAGAGPAPEPSGEGLFALAEATALVTGGIVSIEDTGNRVLAYSRSEGGVDELRRLSILGWQGPENYMAMLREWGVLDRLRAGEQVVRVEEHLELGVRPRLAIGIRAGARYLGTIWVQQRFDPVSVPFAAKAEDALVGAARLAAAEILRRRAGHGGAPAHDHLVELLTGRANTDLVAGRLGLDPAAAALVVAFDGPVEPDAPSRELHRDQVRDVVSMYATAYHRTALVGVVDGRVYAVLSGVAPDRVGPALLSWVRDVVDVIRSRTGLPWRAGVGSPVAALGGLSGARAEADRVLDALARSGSSASRVATISDLRAEVLLGELLDLLGQRPELRHPGVAALVEHDARRGGELVGSLLAYLDALGDVRVAAAALHVHPNTLRHRLRRARAVSGLTLEDPRERLSCHLQLVLVSRMSRPARAPVPARTRPAP